MFLLNSISFYELLIGVSVHFFCRFFNRFFTIDSSLDFFLILCNISIDIEMIYRKE